MIDGPEALGALPGDVDFFVAFVGTDGFGEPGVLPVGEVLCACAEDVPDPVERIVAAAAVAVDVLLDPTRATVADLTER